MTIINVSDTYQIFPDDLKTFDKLPKGTYTVRFNKMEGFSLIKRENLTVDEKMYGNHKEKAEKALKNATGDGYVVGEFETSTRWNDDKDEYVSLAIEEAILTINNDTNIKYLV